MSARRAETPPRSRAERSRADGPLPPPAARCAATAWKSWGRRKRRSDSRRPHSGRTTCPSTQTSRTRSIARFATAGSGTCSMSERPTETGPRYGRRGGANAQQRPAPTVENPRPSRRPACNRRATGVRAGVSAVQRMHRRSRRLLSSSCRTRSARSLAPGRPPASSQPQFVTVDGEFDPKFPRSRCSRRASWPSPFSRR